MSMALVGVCRVTLRLPENHSLKGKRQVLKSLIARLHNRFNVSAAEIDDHDSWQIASLGVSCVSNDERHADQVLARHRLHPQRAAGRGDAGRGDGDRSRDRGLAGKRGREAEAEAVRVADDEIAQAVLAVSDVLNDVRAA